MNKALSISLIQVIVFDLLCMKPQVVSIIAQYGISQKVLQQHTYIYIYIYEDVDTYTHTRNIQLVSIESSVVRV